MPSPTPTLSSSSGPPPESADAHISAAQSLEYWNSVPPTVHGMLGGFPQVSTIDLKGSYAFFRKIQKLHPYTPPYPSDPGATVPSAIVNGDGIDTKHLLDKEGQADGASMLARGLDVGAGIGRVTAGFLSRICKTIDIVEPIAAFASQVAAQKMAGSGTVSDVSVIGLQDWTPKPGVKYDVIWAQWCLGHLTDAQLLEFLKKGKGCLRRDGWIVVKENMSTDTGLWSTVGKDVYDELDSSVTRCDATFRRCFQEAGVRVVRSELQRGLEKGLLPVRFYALRVEEAG